MPGSESWPHVKSKHYSMFYVLLQQFTVSYTTDTPMDYYDESEESYSALLNDPVEETAAGDTSVTEATIAPRERIITAENPLLGIKITKLNDCLYLINSVFKNIANCLRVISNFV